ncbi:hypothetical protein MMC26_003059 [Xylographa opegraphella]|nr:hypothetical protein [Xylographa opegraphella]
MIFVLALLFGVSLAQRPSNASICDYYAESLYGMNSSATQFQLIQSIVALAFSGGSNLTNVSSDITGILNPGTFQGLDVDLQPWFNGVIDSTNLNNQPVGIDWLDDGGLDPLYGYLNGLTSSVVLTNTSNHRLFQHFFLSFAHIFGCSEPPPSPPSNGPPLSLAYVHKYMNLNYTDLGHFINQLSLATLHFGFSDQDSQTLDTNLNSMYNVRCAPPITTNPAQGPQLLSLCQADNCPLAEPNPDCAAYANLTANGVQSGSASSQTSTATSAAFTPTSTALASTTTGTAGAQTTSAAAVASTSSASSLSGGAIAGIVIGAVAALILLIGLVVYYLRRRKSTAQTTPYQPAPVYSQPIEPKHASTVSYGPTVAEMESPRGGRSPAMGMTSPVEMGGHEQHWDSIGPTYYRR